MRADVVRKLIALRSAGLAGEDVRVEEKMFDEARRNMFDVARRNIFDEVRENVRRSSRYIGSRFPSRWLFPFISRGLFSSAR